jgi:uncharacterized membrane protein YcaP (DUF421 family)
MDLHELGLTALRASAIYVFLLVVVRMLGKRTVSGATAFDFMVALILSEVVDEPIYGDVPLVQGLVVVAVVAGWHFVNSYLSYRSRRIDRLTGGAPTVLVKNGAMDRDGMRREHVNEEELWSLLRLQGIDDLGDVKEAILEPDGLLSVLKTDEAKALQRRDLDEVLRKAA